MKVMLGRVDEVSMAMAVRGFTQRVKVVVDGGPAVLRAERVLGNDVNVGEARWAEIIISTTAPGLKRRDLQRFTRVHQNLLVQVVRSARVTNERGVLGGLVVETDRQLVAQLSRDFLISKMVQLTEVVAHLVSHPYVIMSRLTQEIEHGGEPSSVPEGLVVARVLPRLWHAAAV